MTYMNTEIEAGLRNKRILIVDDEQDLANMVKSILQSVGFEDVTLAHNGKEALLLIEEINRCNNTSASVKDPFHLFILDVMMPHMDGFELLSRLRAHPTYKQAPALFLTAKDEPFDRVNGLSRGADDYIVKPFLPQELVLRIAAVLRRCYGNDQPSLRLNACSVNFETAEVMRDDGNVVQLTAKEYEILNVLARNAGRIVTIDALCEACWGTSFGYENSLMTHIRRLREKTEANPSRPLSLITVKGLGYKLILAELR